MAERDFRGAAETYDEIGVPALAADARLLAAEALVAEGRRAEADAELQRALAFYRQCAGDRVHEARRSAPGGLGLEMPRVALVTGSSRGLGRSCASVVSSNCAERHVVESSLRR
jgi:hypothetical protein